MRTSLVTAVLFASGCQHATPTPLCPAPARAVVTDGMVDVGGLSLHVHCVGQGTPIVVLDSGLGADGSFWKDLQPQIGRVTRVCAYDRAGTGYSSPAPRAHTSRQMAQELHTLLNRAGLEGPYVLVGHSLGGLNVRLFTSEYPSEVAGMVLVDATTEEQDARYWALMTEEQRRRFKAQLADSPEGNDYDTFEASLAELRNANRSLGNRPLVVVTHGRKDPEFSPELDAKMESVWQELQAQLPRLSTNSVQVIATNSGHMIPLQAPHLFLTAVSTVVDAVRARGPIDARALQARARQTASFTPDQAIRRFFTQPVSTDMFATSFLREVPVDQAKALVAKMTSDLGALKQVVRDGDRFNVQFERASVPTEATLDEDGRFTMLFFHEPVRESAPPHSPTSGP